jgi:hypothetical protein
MDRSIKYIFQFEDNTKMEFELNFDKSHNLIPKSTAVKDWTKLDNSKCANCPLNSDDNECCPVARNLDDVVEKTKDKISHAKANIFVQTPERTYIKQTDTQDGLLSLFGVIMASSGCPHLNWFKPLARFHLPFSSIEETMFRVLSMELVSDYFSEDNSKMGADGIQVKYKEVEQVNLDFIERIRNFCKGDADLNAIAALDLFAKLFEFEQATSFKSLKQFFN